MVQKCGETVLVGENIDRRFWGNCNHSCSEESHREVPLAGHGVLPTVFESRINCGRKMLSKKKKNVFKKDDFVMEN